MQSEPAWDPFLLNGAAARPTRRLALLGASGSVGTTTCTYLKEREDIELVAASVHSSVERLAELLREHAALVLATISDAGVAAGRQAEQLREQHPRVRFFSGEEGLVEMVHAAGALSVDTALTAVVGACGIEATMAAVACNMKVALANKETLVTAGPAIAALMRRSNPRASFVPVDSEHNALFQLLAGVRPDHLERVILTASGGPFRDLPPERLAQVTRAEVLNHPTWSMGPKITVDSAGMINKGLELIEAHYLFGVAYERLGAYIHRDSVVHGMLETTDGGYLLAASAPDMVFPIAHALSFPEAVPRAHDAARSAPQWPALQFEEVDPARYPGFQICLEAGRAGGTAPAVLNAANEEAVALFLEDRIHFSAIPDMIRRALEHVPVERGDELGLFLEADRRARAVVRGSAA